MKRTTLSLFFLFISVSLAGCGLGGGTADPLAGTSWRLTAIGSRAPLPGTSPTAVFVDGQINGSTGCNQYFGSYKINGDRLTIGELANTEMACLEPAGAMDQETEYLGLLRDVQTYELRDGRLILSGPLGDPLTFDPAR